MAPAGKPFAPVNDDQVRPEFALVRIVEEPFWIASWYCPVCVIATSVTAVRPVNVEPHPVVKDPPEKLLDCVVLAPSEIIVEAVFALAPVPVPGRAPLIVDTISVDAVMEGAMRLVVTIIVLPVRVDKLIVAAFTAAKFDERNVK